MDPDLNPKTITLATFTTLLASYERTVQAVSRTKALAKAKGKGKGKGKGKRKPTPKKSAVTATAQNKKRPATSAAKGEEEEGEGEGSEADELSNDAKTQVAAQVSEFAELDAWRYSVLPGVVGGRGGSNGMGHHDEDEDEEEKEKEGEGLDGYLSKEEAVKLMEWKLKHGIYRPTLLGMIRANQERTIQSATSRAFVQVQGVPVSVSGSSADKDKDESWHMLQKSLETLTAPLRGVGPATASLFLSIASPEIPFYSDDVYLWLCVGVYPSSCSSSISEGKEGEGEGKRSRELRPNGELNVKYNVPEYRRLWEAVQLLRARLNEEAGEGESVSCADVERVALVIRHFDQSGYVKGEGGSGEEEGRDEGGKRKRRRVHVEQK
ncbi:hypothetical protein BJX76DRAFT_359834 [Aspergillus varians]